MSWADRYASKCRGCGKTIIWGIDKDEKRIPLDPVPPVYTLSGFQSKHGDGAEISRLNREENMVSHFVTCPNANQFSGSKKQEGPPAFLTEALNSGNGTYKP